MKQRHRLEDVRAILRPPVRVVVMTVRVMAGTLEARWMLVNGDE